MFALKSCFTKRSFTFLPACRALSRASPSYAFTPTTVPFKYETIGTVLRKQVEKTPQKDLFVFPTDNVSKTYSEFYEDANRFALGLLNLGLQPGDHVALWAPNVYEWTIVQFATALCGIVMVCINPASQPREIEYYFNKAKVKVVIAAEEFKLQNYYETLLEICPEIATHQFGQLHAHRIPTLRSVILIPTTGKQYRGTIQFSEIYSVKGSNDIDRLLDIERTLSPDSPCNIQFTSGTTGSPKAATLSHFGVVNNCIYFGRRTGMIPGTDYRACSPPPLFHVISTVLGSMMAVVNGGTFVMPAHSFDPLACLKAIEQENCTHFGGTPTMFIDVLSHPDFEKYDVSSLRAGFMGGAPVPIEVCKMAREKLNMEDLVIAYGATETSPVTLSTALSDSIQKRTETVGFPLENTEVKIINEEGQTVPVGIAGEICSRGYTTMLGYFDDDVQTKKAIGNDRWFKSGDIGIMSEEGYVKIVGRAKDMIIRGGSNIYPTEIEDFLYSHPGIEEVQVVGVPDARLGEEVCAWIRLRPGFENTSIEEIKEYCKGKLTYYKIPKFIQFKKLEQFPMTASGKIQKFKIREIATKELGLEAVSQHLKI